MCEYKEDMDTFRSGKSYWVTTVSWSLYFLDLRSSQEGVVMLIFVFLIFLNSSCLFYRWSYGSLLYEIFTNGLVQIATVAGLGRKN